MLRTLAPALVSLLVVGHLTSPAAAAQEALFPTEAAAPLSERDSARLLRAMRAEQARFERVRRAHLPWTWHGGGGECDERIGRFCLTHSDGAPEWEPPPEAEEVKRARERLLLQLAEAARLIPGDRWVAGQRVRYLMETHQVEAALAAARECRTEEWWCAALAGFTHHYAGEPGPADSAYTRALAAMPPRERRAWTDLSLLLEGDGLRAYRRLAPEERARFESRFWDLADPFLARPGNELRAEHLSRNVLDLLQDRAASTEGLSWGDDLREILLRYGWPRGWERIRERPGSLGPPSLVSHYSNSDRQLLPPHELLLDSARLAAGEWDRHSARPRTGYSIPVPGDLARWLERLDHQVAVFRRGDSAVVVAAYWLSSDSVPPEAGVEAALALTPESTGRVRIARFARGGLGDVVAASVPGESMLLSLEVLSEEARRAARARYGLSIPPLAPGLLALSDLLLLRSPDPLPDSLPAAVAQARGSTRVQPGERIGVYWELYGLREDVQSLAVSLRLVDQRKSWLRRVAERVGLVSEAAPIRLRWQEQAAPTPLVARSLAVQIPPVAPGTYQLELAVSIPGREELSVTRDIQIGLEP